METNDDIASIAKEALEKASEATEGPWGCSRYWLNSDGGNRDWDHHIVIDSTPREVLHQVDAQFIAFARNNIEALAQGYLDQAELIESLRQWVTENEDDKDEAIADLVVYKRAWDRVIEVESARPKSSYASHTLNVMNDVLGRNS